MNDLVQSEVAANVKREFATKKIGQNLVKSQNKFYLLPSLPTFNVIFTHINLNLPTLVCSVKVP